MQLEELLTLPLLVELFWLLDEREELLVELFWLLEERLLLLLVELFWLLEEIDELLLLVDIEPLHCKRC